MNYLFKKHKFENTFIRDTTMTINLIKIIDLDLSIFKIKYLIVLDLRAEIDQVDDVTW